jgi:ATP-binding cassette subfamily B protein
MAALVVARIFEAGIPFFLKVGIDRIVLTMQGGAPTTPAALQALLLWPTLAILACVLFRFVTIVQGRRLVRRIGVAVAYDLRKRMYAHLQRQGPAFFARHPTGDLMARAINDITLVRQLIGGGLRTLGVITITAIVGFVCMFALAPALTGLLLIPLPVIAIVGWRMSRTVYARSRSVQEGFANLSEQVQENLNGIRTIQALVQEQAEIERFDRVNVDYVARFMALTLVNSRLAALMPWLGAFTTVTILGFGGSLVLQGDMTIGTFTAFFTYVTMVLWPVREAGNLVTQWQQGASACARLFEILDAEPEIEDVPLPAGPHGPRDHVAGHIVLRGLGYRFPGAAAPVLEGVDLDIPAGQTVAILGRVGAGKSTLLKCLVRLLDPPAGSVHIDGVELHAYPLARLRAEVVLVMQDSFLFGDSLRGNLSYDRPEREDLQVWDAAAVADLADTIEGLPERMDTLVGERGVTLSGGQKQRAALARGIIRNAPVLLLDDCFSSVDTETEERILQALARRRGRRTTVLVSHRVSTARLADQIVVLDEGRVVELGTHQALLAQGGWYAELARIQGLQGERSARLRAFTGATASE